MSGSHRALLVANSTYPSDAHNLPDLEGPRNDPSLLRDALCDDRYGLFPHENVRLVVERTMAEVLREAEEFLHGAGRHDTLLLYYSGHGKLDLRGELYLCARDSRADRLRSTAVKASDLRAMIDESAAETTVIMLDCCHSGAFKGGELARTLAGRGRFVVTSCRTGELANDAHARNRASMFTHHVVEGMLGAAPDHDGDGLVGLDDLYGYVHARLSGENRQIPQRSFAGTGDVPMARRPDVVAPGSPAPAATAAAAGEPVLDLSETLIDLHGIDADEELPPERVAVVNRGGGRLDWSVDCTATWVTVTRDEHGILIKLDPRPGTNRANVHVRDNRTGMVKTVRVVVRAERAGAPAATAPSVSPAPAPLPETPAATASTDVPTGAPIAPPRTDGAPRGSRWPLAAMIAATAAGLWLSLSALDFVDAVDQNTGRQVFLRDWDYGPGLGTSILGGVALAAVGAVGLVARVRRWPVAGASVRFLLGAGLGLAGPLVVERAGSVARWDYEWFFPGSSSSFGDVAIVLGFAAAVLCGLALRFVGTAADRFRWAPGWLLPAGVAAAVLWGAGSAVDVYGSDAYVPNYFAVAPDHDAGGVVLAMAVLIVVLAVAVVGATRWLDRAAGSGLLAGAATFVVLVEAIEVATTLLRTGEHRQGAAVLWMLVPAAAYVGAIVVGLRRAARDERRASLTATPTDGAGAVSSGG